MRNAARTPELRERVDLVLHQRDQRRDDDADAVAQERGDLVAQRLAAAGRHEHERVAARHHPLDDRLLRAAEGGVPEHGAQALGGRHGGGASGHRSRRVVSRTNVRHAAWVRATRGWVSRRLPRATSSPFPRGQMDIVPADYPPRFRASDYVVQPTAGEDERIEVGVLFVGGGPAGLAGAVRLGQLLAEDPAVARIARRGPDRGRREGQGAYGSHLMSGAVMRPGPFRSLFPDVAKEDPPTHLRRGHRRGHVLHDQERRVPAPDAAAADEEPRQLGRSRSASSARWMAEQAEELGAYMLPETDAQKLIVDDGRVMGVVTGDKGRGQRGRGARHVRARRGAPRAGHRRVRGHPGPPRRRDAQALRAGRGAADVRARRQGGLGGHQAARQGHPHRRLAAAVRDRSTASTAGRGSTRWARTRSRSAS